MNPSIAIAARSPAGGDDRVDLVDRQRQRLFAQDVLAGLERPDRPFGVEVVGQRDVDDVDVGSLEKRVVRPEGSGDAMRRGERLCAADVPAGDAHELAPFARRDRPNQPRRDPPRPEDAPSKGRLRTAIHPGSKSGLPSAIVGPPKTRLQARLTPLGQCTSLAQSFEQEEHKTR